ncbi:MAG: PAS domain S-box protein [Deltaproteobacteria bacterium]
MTAPLSGRRFSEQLASSIKWLFEGDRVALKITSLYLFLGLTWVLYFCELVNVPEKVRDTIYVSSMAWVLYWLIDHGVKTIRRSEEAFKESEKRMAGILETSPCGILLMDEMGTIAYVNLIASGILGLKRSELIGRNYEEIGWEITDVNGKPLLENNRYAGSVLKSDGPVYDMECTVRPPDRDRVILSFNSAPLYDRTGKITGMVVAFIDITERKRAQDLMVRKLSLAVEQSPSAIMITDTESRIEYVNPSYTRITGYASSEVVGTRTTTLCGESAEQCRSVCSSLCARGERKAECRSVRKNGEPYWESITVTPIRDPGGEITHYLWIREDITAHRKADEDLRESRAKFQSLVESINDWVWEIDGNMIFTYASPRVRDILGYEPAEALGRLPLDLMPEQEARRVLESFEPIFSRREAFEHMENIHLRKDGGLVALEVSGAPFYAPDGSFLGYRGVARDITKRKQAEEELRESEERFREMFEQTEEPIILFAAGSARILDANPAVAAVYGYSRDELVEKGPALFVDPAGMEEFEKSIGGICEGRNFSLEKAYHRRRGGDRIIVSIRGKSIRLKEGLVSYCTFRDITDRVRLEEEAKIQQAKLIHANRMTALGTIVSGVAHEVSNPNNLVMFNAPLLLSAWQDALPVLMREYQENGEYTLAGVPFTEMRTIVPKLLKDISESSLRIKAIVGMLKDFARQDKRRADTPIDVNEVVRTAIGIIQHEIAKGTRSFSVKYGNRVPLVRGGAMELEQVVINLIVNSLQALPDPACGIEVSTSWNRTTGCVEIRVKDEGEGMDPGTMARLAEPFFSTKLESGGLGLGLSISQTIIKEHKGTLTFESEVGKGTTASISLPAASEKPDDVPETGSRINALYH